MVRLLRGSGTRPTLVVSAAPQDATTPTVRGHRVIATGDTTSRTEYGSVKKHSREFKQKMEEVLLEDEIQHVIQNLTQFSHNRYIIGCNEGSLLKSAWMVCNRTSLLLFVCCWDSRSVIIS